MRKCPINVNQRVVNFLLLFCLLNYAFAMCAVCCEIIRILFFAVLRLNDERGDRRCGMRANVDTLVVWNLRCFADGTKLRNVSCVSVNKIASVYTPRATHTIFNLFRSITVFRHSSTIINDVRLTPMDCCQFIFVSTKWKSIAFIDKSTCTQFTTATAIEHSAQQTDDVHRVNLMHVLCADQQMHPNRGQSANE